MKGEQIHADVWVVEQDQATLLRHRDHEWVVEQRLAYTEFIGSAIALSSFSLADTTVYLNVVQNELPTGMWTGHSWAGITEDPLRIVDAPATALHQHLLTELRSMGKTAHVISVKKPEQFNRGTSMTLLNTQEFKHLKNFMLASKAGGTHIQNSLQLYLGLWLKPSGCYQTIRSVALACMIGTFALMSWQAIDQQSRFEKANEVRLRNSFSAISADSKSAPFDAWILQLRKFGQDKRANVVSLKMSWDERGEIQSTADLERDRKRAPKTCILNRPKQAQCSLGALGQ